jgi:two-component system KDP operon response regulator KdpE
MTNILIVDTNSESIDNVVRILSVDQFDWVTSIIDSGKQCLDAVKNDSCPDAVIIGMQLADVPGLDLVERIREYSDVPIIVLSHDKDIFTLVKAFDNGPNDYKVEPFNKNVFIARLKALIRRRMWDIRIKEYKSWHGNNYQLECQPLSGE